MYLQCKDGFVEADRWDGNPVGLTAHRAQIQAAMGDSDFPVIVVRSREEYTLRRLIAHLPRSRADGVLPCIVVLGSPPSWDYEWRVYLSGPEWGMVLVHVANGLDYRNFKSWCGHNAPNQAKLAHDIWHDAYKPRQ